MTEKPFDVLPLIKNAGEILLGEYTPVTLCNFVLGPNAILPTGGFAKTYSSVSVMLQKKGLIRSVTTHTALQQLKALKHTH